MTAAHIADALARLASTLGGTGIGEICALSGGASHELWGFSLLGAKLDLVLRRLPDTDRHGEGGLGLTLEAELMTRARSQGTPVPQILHVCGPDDGLGQAYVMAHVDGETLPKRILRGDRYEPARAVFADDCAAALVSIHQTRVADLGLRRMQPADAIDSIVRRRVAVGDVRPVFDLALCHLEDTLPDAAEADVLVHGDFRMGNLMFGPDGLRAVLDWELAFAGDRHADIGWLCMESWRFGGAAPVGGIAQRNDLLTAYRAAGGDALDPARVAWWEVWSALAWGVICTEMGVWVAEGSDRSVERHVIARRASETELILMAHLTGRAV